MAEANVNSSEEEFYCFCYQCRLKFINSRLFFISISSDETKFTCVKCGITFALGLIVKKSDFDDYYPHCCEVCGMRFRTSNQLFHHSYHHSNNWPFKCYFCQKGFPFNCRYKRHLSPKTVQCCKCSESFLGNFCPARVFDENDEFKCEKCSNDNEPLDLTLTS
ncbi:hypothetical protein TNIN_105821 [Trichonephila inaurata madagascariensis]|uniref:C2H2-type domain-containing protein n=1 Tax=Trichonephila inaurata madagascariensis TaxID=2747483 RepID=A0A8X6XYK5_9ARAC|nr:hypothetical protein TNIN_105821 [Trichonephila inaurata madagascariensis]